MDRRREIGFNGEAMALSYLEKKGLKLLCKNYRCRIGEVDLIMQDGSQLVIIEVRTKTSNSFGTGLESITFKKQAKIKLVAQQYLASCARGEQNIRFDVVSICCPPDGPAVLEHLREAF